MTDDLSRERDVKRESMGTEPFLADVVPDATTTEYLDSFNIDMESNAGDAPHYVVNLNAFNSDDPATSNSALDSLATLPVGGPLPSISTPGTISHDGTSSPSTSIPATQPYLRPMGRSRGRGRTRFNPVPLDDVMEKKIMTFEGRDCVQHLEELQKLFPRFKRAHINRVFTRNMLNFDKTFQQLNEQNNKEIAKVASVRLVQANKPDTKPGPKGKSDITPLNPQSFLYLDVPLGRCPPHIASTLYRRVIVNPDGSVESADEHENRYLDMNGIKVKRPLLPPVLPPPPRPTQDTNTQPNSFEGSRPDNPQAQCTPLHQQHPTLRPAAFSEQVSTTSKTILPPQFTALGDPITPRLSGNRFFRSNRVCEAENKKRGYVDRELHNAKPAVTPTNSRRPRTGAQRGSDAGSGAASDGKDGDAVTYMASVGVVSTPNAASSKKRSSKGQSNQPVDEPKDETPKVDEPLDDDLDLTKEERRNVLAFFNEARCEELVQMPGCSRKTAQILMSLRPFQNMSNLYARISGTRYLSPNLIFACKEILQMRSTIVRLMQRCERITERVACHASKLLSSTVNLINVCTSPASEAVSSSEPDRLPDGSVVGHLLTQQPAILNPLRELKPYQLVGLNWLRLLHHEQVNGILADEMGLGKTVQAIAFLASLWESGDRGPHLIICPSSTQDNWLRELADWCSHLKVLVYQGPLDQRKAIRLKIYEAGTTPDFNILLTSYATGTSTIEDRALLKRVNFHYGIFDEAHMLKNMSSHRYRHLSNFRVQRRLLLTGTPLQNNLLELVSLLSFLMPDMFARSTDLLKRMFQIYSKPISERKEDSLDLDDNERSNFEVERLEQAKNLLQPFFLRRLKSQVLDQLPPKTSETVRVPMTESQEKHYWSLVEKLRKVKNTPSVTNGAKNVVQQVKIEDNDACDEKRPRLDHSVPNGALENVEPSKSAISLDSPSNMVALLRKAANHQALLSGIAFSEASLRDISETLHLDPSHTNSDPNLIFEDLSVLSDHQVHKVCQFYDILSSYTLPIEMIMSGSGKLVWLNENIPRLIKEGHRILIFSQFVIVLDLLEEFLRSRDQRYLRLDGSTPVSDRQELIDRFNSSSIEIFLLSTRAGGLGINLTGADTVVIHDIDFNPYNDKQAEDRVHRLGQTKPVHIIRLISKGTVEEGIFRIASEKLQLEQNVTGANETDREEAECGAEELEEELTEPTDIVLKTLGSPKQSLAKRSFSSCSRRSRLSDREFWSLLEDALTQSQ